MKRKAIPHTLHDQVWQWYAGGATSTKIAELLVSEYGLTVGKTAINNLIIEIKEERKQIAQSIYAEAVAKTACADVFIITDVIKKLYSDFNDLRDAKDYKIARTYAETLSKYIAQRINLSGLNNDKNEKSEDDVRNELLNRLNELD